MQVGGGEKNVYILKCGILVSEKSILDNNMYAWYHPNCVNLFFKFGEKRFCFFTWEVSKRIHQTWNGDYGRQVEKDIWCRGDS